MPILQIKKVRPARVYCSLPIAINGMCSNLYGGRDIYKVRSVSTPKHIYCFLAKCVCVCVLLSIFSYRLLFLFWRFFFTWDVFANVSWQEEWRASRTELRWGPWFSSTVTEEVCILTCSHAQWIQYTHWLFSKWINNVILESPSFLSKKN